MNDAQIWDTIAVTYDKEIFSVFKSDKKEKLKRQVNNYAGKTKDAIDFGCGIGLALPMLSPKFKQILAVDISQKCIDLAKTLGYKNVTFDRVDLAAKKINMPLADFGICCNVAIMGNKERNYRIIRNVMYSLKRGGAAIFVFPSLESVSLSTLRLIDLHAKEKTFLPQIPKNELQHLNVKYQKQILQGIINIEDAPTQHYTLPELYSLMNAGDFKIQTIDQLEYDWKTEFHEVPKWMGLPYPWDWMVVVKKIR